MISQYERRQTTDNRRQTTDNRQPTTDNRKKKQQQRSALFLQIWARTKALGGTTPTGGRIGAPALSRSPSTPQSPAASARTWRTPASPPNPPSEKEGEEEEEDLRWGGRGKRNSSPRRWSSTKWGICRNGGIIRNLRMTKGSSIGRDHESKSSETMKLCLFFSSQHLYSKQSKRWKGPHGHQL